MSLPRISASSPSTVAGGSDAAAAAVAVAALEVVKPRDWGLEGDLAMRRCSGTGAMPPLLVPLRKDEPAEVLDGSGEGVRSRPSTVLLWALVAVVDLSAEFSAEGLLFLLGLLPLGPGGAPKELDSLLGDFEIFRGMRRLVGGAGSLEEPGGDNCRREVSAWRPVIGLAFCR
mmetsp:Transcript_22413/g.47769  ORF Transcript_22413/g.47769 Transcript_22413/m.47769 type:complete len:172 (-) Transcript_22413:162-677(-)